MEIWIAFGIWLGPAICAMTLVSIVHGYARARGLNWWAAQAEDPAGLHVLIFFWPVFTIIIAFWFLTTLPGRLGKQHTECREV